MPEDASKQGMDFRRIKAVAAHRLPPGDLVREALLQEPDTVPWDLAAGKVVTYVQLLLKRPRKP